MKPAVQIEDLGKRYTITHRTGNGEGLRHALERALRRPLDWVRSAREPRQHREDFWALRHLSFSIEPGEVVGIIGRNGAGKSTLLKLLSRITVPTEGRISIHGRVASLLEVGTGFHQELTGRENIFLNGAILGMSRAEIVRKFDEIVAFSEIEDFLDTPVKRYSSGMYVRLAFAVAAHLEPEILIIDEVLAVGDSAFQKKCLGKMESFAQSGRTVLFVSHNLDAVRSLCQTGLWLKNGRFEQKGPANQVIDAYLNSLSEEAAFTCSNPHYGFTVDTVTLKNARGEKCSLFAPGDDLTVEIEYTADRRIDHPVLALGVVGVHGTCFTSNMILDGHWPASFEGRGTVRCTFRAIPLLPQEFSVRLRVQTTDLSQIIIPYQDVAYFSVAADLADYGYHSEAWRWTRNSTPMVIPYTWELPDGAVASVSLQKAPATVAVSAPASSGAQEPACAHGASLPDR